MYGQYQSVVREKVRVPLQVVHNVRVTGFLASSLSPVEKTRSDRLVMGDVENNPMRLSAGNGTDFLLSGLFSLRPDYQLAEQAYLLISSTSLASAA